MSVTIGSGHEGNVRQQIDAYVARVKGGEMGALPSVLSLFVLTILFSVPLILAFCGEWGRQIVTDGFAALDTMPEYYRYTLGIIVSASFGTRAATKFFGKK